MAEEKKSLENSIPGMNRRERFAEAEHAQNAGAALKRLLSYFSREKALAAGMLANEIAQIYGQLQTAIAGAERVFVVLDEENEDMSGQALPECADPTVTFDHVNFSYQSGHPVIRDFSLTVPSGKKVALVGSTGSGKTTVVNFLMRFYDVDSGSIRIDGQDIAGVSRQQLRKMLRSFCRTRCFSPIRYSATCNMPMKMRQQNSWNRRRR